MWGLRCFRVLGFGFLVFRGCSLGLRVFLWYMVGDGGWIFRAWGSLGFKAMGCSGLGILQGIKTFGFRVYIPP